jgi:hypothetical protein
MNSAGTRLRGAIYFVDPLEGAIWHARHPATAWGTVQLTA